MVRIFLYSQHNWPSDDIQVPTSTNVCFCTTRDKQKKNVMASCVKNIRTKKLNALFPIFGQIPQISSKNLTNIVQ